MGFNRIICFLSIAVRSPCRRCATELQWDGDLIGFYEEFPLSLHRGQVTPVTLGNQTWLAGKIIELYEDFRCHV